MYASLCGSASLLDRAHVYPYTISYSNHCAWSLWALLHADNVSTRLLSFHLPEKTLHGRLKVSGDETVDHRIQAAVQAAEGDSHMVHNHMMRQIRMEVKQNLTDVKRREADSEDNQHGRQQLYSFHASVSALLHEARAGKGAHDSNSKHYDDHHRQEELKYGQCEKFGEAEAWVLEGRCEKWVGHDDGKQPNADAHCFGHTGVPPLPWGLRLHDGQVAINADAGEEEDATVHVDKVAEYVHVGTVEALSSTVVQYDTSGEGKVNQQIRHNQVNGVDDRCSLWLGPEAEDIQSQTVQGHPYHKDKCVDDHQSYPQAVKVIIETLIQVGQCV